VCDYIFQGLVRYDEKMELGGQLAKGWDISPDNRQWTFYLREDVRWHDGEPFTARDVEFTFNTIAFDEDYPGSRRDAFSLLEDIAVVDDYTITFTLIEPRTAFLANLSQGIIPRHLYDPSVAVGADRVPIADMARHPRNWNPIGTGPFIYSTWAESQYLILERNEDYYAPAPFLQSICLQFFPSTEAAVSALEAGEVDLVTDIPFAQAHRLEASSAQALHLYSAQEMGYELLGFNFRPGAFGTGMTNPWLDRRVRQAVAHALNREHYLQELLSGRGVLLDSPIPAASWAHSPEQVHQYSYDPDIAAGLLTEAGWSLGGDGLRYRDGQPFAFQLTVREDNALEVAMAEMIRADLGAVGIKMEVNAVPWQTMLVDHVYAGEFQMFLMGLSFGPDPAVYDIFHSTAARNGLNFGAYNEPKLDIALKLGRQSGSRETRRELYADVQRVLTSDLPIVFLFSREVTTAAREGVHGLEVSPLGLCWPERWYIQE